MNWVDVVILSALGFALLSGFRRGAIMQAFGWGGFLAGLFVGAAVAPSIVGLINPSTQAGKVGWTLGVFLGIAFLVEGLVAAVGLKVRKKLTNPGARHADAIVGCLIALFFALASSWYLGYLLAKGPSKSLAADLKKSKIITWTDSIAPRPPGFLAAIGRFLDKTGFPDVFAQLNPSLAPGVEPPPDSLKDNPEILAAAAKTYKIESKGCGGVVDGSGFPLDKNTVITAAHVVAGTRNQRIIAPNGDARSAIVVFIDSKKDIAVLYVRAGMPGALDFEEAVAKRGSDGAAVGYPGGGPRRISPARVRTETNAVGRDIYSQTLVTRAVYVLSTRVRQGNSGGPFVDVKGRVRGMIFAASASNSNEAYALAGSEVSRAYRLGHGKTRAVATGDCAI